MHLEIAVSEAQELINKPTDRGTFMEALRVDVKEADQTAGFGGDDGIGEDGVTDRAAPMRCFHPAGGSVYAAVSLGVSNITWSHRLRFRQAFPPHITPCGSLIPASL